MGVYLDETIKSSLSFEENQEKRCNEPGEIL